MVSLLGLTKKYGGNSNEVAVYHERLDSLNKHAQEFFDLIDEMSGYHKSEDPTDEFLADFRKRAVNLEHSYVKKFDWDDEVLYIHYLARHAVALMKRHGWLGEYSCETIEQKNHVLAQRRRRIQRADESGQQLKTEIRQLNAIVEKRSAPKRREYDGTKRRDAAKKRRIDGVPANKRARSGRQSWLT